MLLLADGSVREVTATVPFVVGTAEGYLEVTPDDVREVDGPPTRSNPVLGILAQLPR
jgi:hypothetical protein